MLDNDQLTDSDELRELRHSMSGLAMAGPPRLDTIRARGGARRRRRLSRVAGLCVAGCAAAAALALGITGGLGRGTIQTVAPGTIRTASFTLVRNTDGTATLTINPKELFDAAALQSDLARYVRPGGHAGRHPVELRQLPARHGSTPGVRGAHRHGRLHLHQHRAHNRTA